MKKSKRRSGTRRRSPDFTPSIAANGATPRRAPRARYEARAAPRRTIPPALLKPVQKFEQGVYTMTDVRWGMALDLSSADNRSPIAFGSHGWEQQQVSNQLAAYLLASFDFRRNPEVGKRDCSHASYKLSGNSVTAAPVLRSRTSAAACSSFLSVLEELQGIHLESSVEAVTGDFNSLRVGKWK
jgi:hypothetical protein